MPLVTRTCKSASESDDVLPVRPVTWGLLSASSPLLAVRDGTGTTITLKGVAVGEAEACGEPDDVGAEVAADNAEETKDGLPEIWVVRRAKPVRLPVEDVPDPKGFLTAPGTVTPHVEEVVFPGLTLLGTPGFGACTEGFTEGRAGRADGSPDGGGMSLHSSISTYHSGLSGGAGTGSK